MYRAKNVQKSAINFAAVAEQEKNNYSWQWLGGRGLVPGDLLSPGRLRLLIIRRCPGTCGQTEDQLRVIVTPGTPCTRVGGDTR